jgi:hypothetical protein
MPDNQMASSGPARTLTEQRFGYGTDTNEADFTVNGTLRIALNNPSRIQMTIVNNGQATAWVSSKRSVSNTTGIPIGAGGGFMILTVAEDGERTGWEMWANIATNGTVLHVEETVVRR